MFVVQTILNAAFYIHRDAIATLKPTFQMTHKLSLE